MEQFIGIAVTGLIFAGVGVAVRLSRRSAMDAFLREVATRVGGSYAPEQRQVTFMHAALPMRYWVTDLAGASTVIDVRLPADTPLWIELRPRAAMASTRPIRDSPLDVRTGHFVFDVLFEIVCAPRDVLPQLFDKTFREIVAGLGKVSLTTEDVDDHRVLRMRIHRRVERTTESLVAIAALAGFAHRAVAIDDELATRNAPATEGAPFRSEAKTQLPESIRIDRKREVDALRAARRSTR